MGSDLPVGTDLATESAWFAVLAEVAPGVPGATVALEAFLREHPGGPSPRLPLARALLRFEQAGDPRAVDVWELAATPLDVAGSPATARALARLTAPPRRPLRALGQWLDAPWWHGELLAGGVAWAPTAEHGVAGGPSVGWIEGVELGDGIVAAELDLGWRGDPVAAGRLQYGAGALWAGVGYSSAGAVQELVRVTLPRYGGSGWQLETRGLLEQPWDGGLGVALGLRVGFAWGSAGQIGRRRSERF